MRVVLSTWLGVLIVTSCAHETPDGELWRGNVTLVSSYWKDVLGGQDALRTGHSLYLQTVNPALVTPGAQYAVTIANQRDGLVVLDSSTLADARGMFEMTTLLHDIGQGDGIADGDTLEVTLGHGGATFTTEVLVADRVRGELGSAAIDPLVYAVDKRGSATNAFVTDADHYDYEPFGAVYATARGLPTDVTKVDIYVVEDRDRWAGEPLPRSRADGLIRGPIAGIVVDGVLAPTNTGFVPALGDLGIYDLIVDVDRNGVFDYEYDRKDGADGEAKIGLTVQRSAKWLAELPDRHILVNLAYDSARTKTGTFRNVYRRGEPVYIYVNPPINKAHHGKVTKWLVAHRDFGTFWDKPAADGTVDFRPYAIRNFDDVPQTGCTNTPPSYVGDTDDFTDPSTGEPATRIDIVLDYNGDGRYEAGVDILDVASVDESATMILPDAARSLDASHQGGLRVE